MQKKFFHKILEVIFICFLFCFVSGYAIFQAYGYNMEFDDFSITSTSAVKFSSVFDSVAGDVEVYLNGVLVSQKLPVHINRVELGQHILEVYKSGFVPWKSEFVLNENFIVAFEDVYLYKNDTPTVPSHLDNYLFALDYKNENPYFVVKNNAEIWDINKDIMITRKGKTVTNVWGFHEGANYIYTTNSQASVCNVAGNYCKKLIDFDPDLPVLFVSSRKTLYFQQNGVLSEFKIF